MPSTNPNLSERGTIALKLLCCIVGGVATISAAIAFVNQATCTGSKKTCVITYTPTAGNLEVLAISSQNTPSSIAQTNVTFTQRSTVAVGARACFIYDAVNVGASPGTTITMNFAANSETAADVSEYSGIATSSAIDATATAASGTSTAPATNTITTTNADDLLFALACAPRASTVRPSDYNHLTEINLSSSRVTPEYQIVASTNTYSTSWTIGFSDDWGALLTSYKASGGGGAVVKDPIMRGLIPFPRAFMLPREFWPEIWGPWSMP